MSSQKSTAAYHALGLARVSTAQLNSALYYSVNCLHGRRQYLCNALKSAAVLTFANAFWTQSENIASKVSSDCKKREPAELSMERQSKKTCLL